MDNLIISRSIPYSLPSAYLLHNLPIPALDLESSTSAFIFDLGVGSFSPSKQHHVLLLLFSLQLMWQLLEDCVLKHIT